MTDRDNGKLFTDATRAGLLVLAFAVAAVIAVVGLAVGEWSLTIVGLALAVALAGSLAAYLLVTERRRHEAAEEELTSEARFLESLVDSMGRIVGTDDVLDCSHPANGRAARPPKTRSSSRCVRATTRSVRCA